MPVYTRPATKAAPLTLSVAIAALLGATFLVSPMSARADSVIHAPIQLVQADKTQAAADPAATKAETVEERIANLTQR